MLNEEYAVDPALAEEVRTRAAALDPAGRAAMASLMRVLLLCFDDTADAHATLLTSNRGILRVIGVNTMPETAAMLVYAANEVLNDNNRPPAKELWN